MARYSTIPPPLVLAGTTPGHRPQAKPGRIHAARKRLSLDVVRQLVIDYGAGQSTAALCKTYGLGKGTVLGILTEHDVPMRGRGIPDDQLAEAIRLYSEGWPLRKLGPRLGCSPDAVRLGLIRAGVTLRKPLERG